MLHGSSHPFAQLQKMHLIIKMAYGIFAFQFPTLSEHHMLFHLGVPHMHSRHINSVPLEQLLRSLSLCLFASTIHFMNSSCSSFNSTPATKPFLQSLKHCTLL